MRQNTITGGWTYVGSALRRSPGTVRNVGIVMNKAGHLPDSDRSRAPKPQVDASHAVVMLLALMATGVQSMTPFETYCAWNIPLQSPLEGLREGMSRFGVTLPADDDVRFGRDVLMGLVEVATRRGGQDWVTEAVVGVTIWQDSTRAALHLKGAPSVEFELPIRRWEREREEKAPGAVTASVRSDVNGAIFRALGNLVASSRYEAQKIGHAIPTEATIKSLEPPPIPSLEEPPTGGGQGATTTPESKGAAAAPTAAAPSDGQPTTKPSQPASLNKSQSAPVCVSFQPRRAVSSRSGCGSTHRHKGQHHEHAPP